MIEALLDDVLDADLVTDAVDEAVRILEGDDEADATRLATLDTQIAKVDAERGHVVAAIAAGGHLDSLVQALKARETQRITLEAERKAVRSATRLKASEADHVRNELLTFADDWRQVLADDPAHARPIITMLLHGRVTITPTTEHRWQLRGRGHLTGLFALGERRKGSRPQRG